MKYCSRCFVGTDEKHNQVSRMLGLMSTAVDKYRIASRLCELRLIIELTSMYFHVWRAERYEVYVCTDKTVCTEVNKKYSNCCVHTCFFFT